MQRRTPQRSGGNVLSDVTSPIRDVASLIIMANRFAWNNEESSKKRREFASVLDMPIELEGVPIPWLMAGWARLLKIGAIEDPAAVYAHSRPVKRLNYFISHAWASPWITKLIALWYYLNSSLAICITLVLLLVPAYIQIFMPTRVPELFQARDASRVDGTLQTRFLLCSAVAAVAFPVLLMSLHRFGRRTKEHAFLDVACIDQLDAAAKLKGIASLGAVLARTERLVILSDETYWTRLWTVFEVAAFYRRAGVSRMDLVPLHATMREFTQTIFLLAVVTLMPEMIKLSGYSFDALTVRNTLGLAFFVVIPSGLIPGIGIFWAEKHVRNSQKAIDALSEFKLSETHCHSDEDREALLGLIGEWYTDYHAGETDRRRLEQLGHHNFEMLIRHEIAPMLQRHNGKGTVNNGKGMVRLLRPAMMAFVPFAYDMLSSPLPFGHSVELAINRIMFIPLVMPAMMEIQTLAVWISRVIQGKSASSKSPTRAGIANLVGVFIMLVSFTFTITIINYFIEAGRDHYPTRTCAANDGLDEATRAIYKWKALIFFNACWFLVVLVARAMQDL